MQVAAVSYLISKNNVNVVAEDNKMVSQGCLLSSSDEGRVVFKKFLHESLKAVSGEGLDKIVEVDCSGMLALLEKSNVGHYDNVKEAVEKNKQLRLGEKDRFLRSEFVEGSSGANIRLSSEDVGMKFTQYCI